MEQAGNSDQTQFKLLLFQYLLDLWLKDKNTYRPTLSEEIWQRVFDLQLNVFYHVSPLKTLFAMEKAICLTSQEIKQSIISAYRLYDWFDLFIAKFRMEIWAMLLENQMSPQ